ncbi:hypothetical protein RI845_07980 [Thalassotalea nanhaiensis]|uniref:Uncharacterized protein n=1 Tax=Thalassotalea nanhaiensis TaxID=3065648 RepID=A0ABY9TML1_9GAMM|nr:hypothetical protein RI845_07980 [Colwelliaceae bacterium SQ345]
MPSSTSSSKIVEREIPNKNWATLFVVMVSLFVVLIAGWEMYWRSEGAKPAYINSDSLWAIERRKVQQDSVVFTGSSRMLFNMQTDIWQQQTGVKPIQLSLEGTTPLGVLEDLADDEQFKGTVFAGVAPGLFFSGYEYRKNALKAYKKEAPSQWLGQQLAMLIEPLFAFMKPDFALFTVLKRQNWPERNQVKNNLDVRALMVMSKDRNTQMWDKVVNNEEYRQLAIKIWMQGFEPIDKKSAEDIAKMHENRDKQIARAVAVNKKMIAKGAKLFFVRMPSQGFYTMEEGMYNPKETNWDVLLKETGAPGIHFEDYPDLSKYTLPEDSHLTAHDAKTFTKDFVSIYQSLNGQADFSTLSSQ